MTKSTLFFVLVLLCLAAYRVGSHRSMQVASGNIRALHSLPGYYGFFTALWCCVPALILLGGWLAFEGSIITQMIVSGLPEDVRNQSPEQLGLILNDVRNLVAGKGASSQNPVLQQAAQDYIRLHALSDMLLGVLALCAAVIGGFVARQRIQVSLKARNHVEGALMIFLIACSMVAIFTTVGIVLSVLFESIRFFQLVPITEFLFGTDWSPQMAIRPDQVGSSGAFGAVPLFTGTLLISAIAMAVAVPVGLLSAIYMAEYASPQVRAFGKPLLEILAGVPTVVYGFFAALTVAPFVRDTAQSMGLDASSESALAAGLVMGVMIIPFVSSLADDFINAVPQSLRDGAYALGATQSETIRNVVIPAALPGIVGGILLAVSRAIGETMIVVMAAGLAANLTGNPLQAVTTVTTQIVTLLVGDQEFDSPKTLAAFALGLVLFLATLALNVIAMHIVRKYREQYE